MRRPLNTYGVLCIARATVQGKWERGYIHGGAAMSNESEEGPSWSWYPRGPSMPRLNVLHLTCAEHRMSLSSLQSCRTINGWKSLPSDLPQKRESCLDYKHTFSAKTSPCT
jgi:hypothetical protein